MTTIALLVVAAYFSGSLPFGVWIGRLGGVDVQRAGSRNTGATNVARTSGWRFGVVTLLCDAAKGFVPVLIAKHLLTGPWSIAAVGLAAVSGHIFSCFLRFRGGKGVATALGVFMAIDPPALAVGAIVFVVVVLATRYVSLASILASLAVPATAVVIGKPPPIQFLEAAVALLIIWRHRENIDRLLHGLEPRFKAKS